MHIPLRIWHYFKENRFARLLTAQIVIVAIVGLSLVGGSMGANLFGASAQSCSKNDTTYTVVRGDSLDSVAKHHHTTIQNLASHNHLNKPYVLSTGQHLCVPPQPKPVQHPAKGWANTFPEGQCTWWADERFRQLHGFFVPWNHGGAEAWQWKDRARDFHWKVSGTPVKGAIVDLQPGVHGAWDSGHVAVVEKVLRNGHFVASNMNWGSDPYAVVNVEFTPGAGVSFITYQ